MVYSGPHMFLQSNAESVDILRVLYDCPAGCLFSQLLDATQMEKERLLSLLFRMKGYLLVESFRPIPNQRIAWRIPGDSLHQVSKILSSRCFKTPAKPLSGVA